MPVTNNKEWVVESKHGSLDGVTKTRYGIWANTRKVASIVDLWDNAEANARLIAKAPELLTNLVVAISTYEDRIALCKEDEALYNVDDYLQDVVGHYTILLREANNLLTSIKGE